MADVTLTFYGTVGVTNVTPKFLFSSGTVKVEVEDVYIKDLTSNVEDDIALEEGEKLEYICSDYDAITRMYFQDDKVSGDISGWTLPTALTILYAYNTSVSGDISGWTLPDDLLHLRLHNTSVSGDISGWAFPAPFISLYLIGTSVSGDISGWAFPNTTTSILLRDTSLSGDISGWTLPTGLAYLYVDDTSVDYDSDTGAFEDVTASLVTITFNDSSLTQAQVDNVLADLVTSTIEDKILDIGGDNARPSTAGLADVATLESRGWTITIVGFAYSQAIIIA